MNAQFGSGGLAVVGYCFVIMSKIKVEYDIIHPRSNPSHHA